MQLCEPLNILLLGTILKRQGHAVRIIDQNANPEQDACKEIARFAPDLAGVTATTTLVNDAYRIGDFCRKAHIRCVIGGAHASALPGEALSRFDMVVQGEGEQALHDILVKNIQSGIVTAPFIQDLDGLPVSDRSLINMRYYAGMGRTWRLYDALGSRKRVANLITMRGCPFRCEYCYNSERTYPVRYMSAQRMVDEVQYLVKDIGIDAIYFQDDEFFINQKRLESFCAALMRKNIQLAWGAFSRAQTLTSEMLDIAHKAGCRFLCLGLESGSPRMLEVMHKDTTIEKMSQGIKLCNKFNIASLGIFMIGYPGETEEDLKQTEEFIMRHKIDQVGLAIYTPFPGSALWNYSIRENKIQFPVDYSKFTFDDVVARLNDMTVSDIHRWRSRILIRGYLQPYRFRKLLSQGFKAHNISRASYLCLNAARNMLRKN